MSRKRLKTDGGDSLNDSAISLSDDKTSSSVFSDLSANESKIEKSRKPKKNKQYVCEVCHKEFRGSSDLRKHLRIHSDERPYECPQCQKRFRQAICMKNHIASIHGTQMKFQCTDCRKSFPIKERLRLHMRIHSGERPYACKMCPKTFARGGQLRQHSVTHSNENHFICSSCPETFSSVADLKTHLKSHEKTIPQMYLCHICDKKFVRTENLRIHLNRFHADEKTFYCRECQKTFQGHFHKHKETHLKVRPFSCDICSANFAQKSQLNVHMRTHSGERPFECKVCRQSFAHSNVLKLHYRKHTGEKPFKCVLCTDNYVAFSQLAHMKNHMKTIHKKDNPYMCLVCHNFFKTKSDLCVHTTDSPGCSDNVKNSGGENLVKEAESLTQLRLLVAVLLKRISSEDRLKQLGFDKRLIDNVVITALKLNNRKIYEDEKLSEFDRLKLNVEEFLDWIIPETTMQTLKTQEQSIEVILDKIATAYVKPNQ